MAIEIEFSNPVPNARIGTIFEYQKLESLELLQFELGEFKMYKLLSLLPILSFCAIASAADTNKKPTQLINSTNTSIKMYVLSSTPEGVPTSIGFSKGKTIIDFAIVTSNDEPIDISAGEVYDVTGPVIEGEDCNLNAKLSFIDDGIKIEYDANKVKTEFSKSCSELASLAGTYNNIK